MQPTIASNPLTQPAVTYLPTIDQSEANSEITNQELVPDTLDPTNGYKYPSLGTPWNYTLLRVRCPLKTNFSLAMELVPTIVIAASACAQSPECRCELCVDDEGGSRAVPWRSIVAMECATNPHCPCESYYEDWYEGALYYIIDIRNSREMLASRQRVLTTTEINHLHQHQVVPRYLIMEYWSGWTYCVIDPVPQMFDGDGEFLGYTNEELFDKANTGIFSGSS